jgi:hypothetical protein
MLLGYLIPQLIIQAICIIHLLKTGKNRIWLIVLLLVPYLGCAIYFFMEILPSIRSGKVLEKASQVEQAFFPARKIQLLEDQIAFADTYQNKMLLAEAYASVGRYEEAIGLFNKMLTGLYQDDPFALGKRALTYYASGNTLKAKEDFEHIMKTTGKLNEKEQLIYAILLDDMNFPVEAEKAFTKAVHLATGLEAEYRYAMFLKKLGRENEAIDLFLYIVRKAKSSPSYFRRLESKWLKLTKEELSAVNQ